MTKLSGNVDTFYNDVYNNLNNAKTDFSYIRSIYNDMNIYHTFEEKANLEAHISDSYNMMNELESLLAWTETTKKNIEQKVDSLYGKAISLPYRDVSARKGLI